APYIPRRRLLRSASRYMYDPAPGAVKSIVVLPWAGIVTGPTTGSTGVSLSVRSMRNVWSRPVEFAMTIWTASPSKTSRPLTPGPTLPIGGPGICGTSTVELVERKPRKKTSVPSTIFTSPSVIVSRNGTGGCALAAGATRDRPATATPPAAPSWMKLRRVVPRAGALARAGGAGAGALTEATAIAGALRKASAAAERGTVTVSASSRSLPGLPVAAVRPASAAAAAAASATSAAVSLGARRGSARSAAGTSPAASGAAISATAPQRQPAPPSTAASHGAAAAAAAAATTGRRP